jgi:CubicO group peptidase (beta-lactamase class C family)
MTYSRLFSALLLLAIPGCSNAAACPPDGPLLPRPTTLHTSPAIKNSTETLTSILNNAVSGDLKVPWAVSNVSFSVAVVSLDTPDPTAPLWEYHHLATGNTNGTKNVDGDSQYLIGSISKVFTDLLLLKTGLNLDDPITKFLPELKSKDSPIRWDEISLSSLGDHLSGMPPTCKYFTDNEPLTRRASVH